MQFITQVGYIRNKLKFTSLMLINSLGSGITNKDCFNDISFRIGMQIEGVENLISDCFT